MTTIAYRDGVFASDSRITNGAFVETDRGKKLFRLSNGVIMAAAGHAARGTALIAFVDKLKTVTAKTLVTPIYKGTHALLVTPEGHVWYYDAAGWEMLKPSLYPYYAIGSGSTYAIPAMDAGASAVESVRVGIRRDIYSGGRVQTMEV